MSGQSNVEYVFEAKDRDGDPVRCDAKSWKRKIAREHPELAGCERHVAEAIEQPDLIFRDRDYPDRRVFLKLGTVRPKFYLRVVVEYALIRGSFKGRVVTAFLTPDLREGDTLLWVRP